MIDKHHKYNKEEIRQIIELTVPEVVFDLFGANVSTKEGIEQARADWAFVRRCRKIFSVIITTGIIGTLSWLGSKIAALGLRA